MSIVNDSNYANQVPTEDDYTIFVRDSDGVIKTVTMLQLAELFQTIAGDNLTVTVISTDQTLTTEQIVESNSAGTVNITLPDSALNTGRQFKIYNAGAGTVNILAAGSDTISGDASISLAQYESAVLSSDGIGTWIRF